MRGYLCVGGPLHGQRVTREELKPERRANRDFGQWKAGDVMCASGRFGLYASDYFAYNRADARQRHVPTMIWIHRTLLP